MTEQTSASSAALAISHDQTTDPTFSTRGPRVAEFARTFCRHTKGRWKGQRFEFEPWQHEFINEAFRLGDDDKRVYQDVLLGIPRKSGKSTMAAAIALYLLIADKEPGPEVILASGSADQAGLVFSQAKAFVESDVRLTQWLNAQRMIIRVRNESYDTNFLKRIAADGALQHGANPSGIVFDELHAITKPGQEELWSAMTTGDGAREHPLTLAITTAGFDKDTVLGRLYDAALASDTGTIEKRPGLTIVRDPEAGFLMWWFGIDDADDHHDIEAVKLANPASWITKEYLAKKLANPKVSDADYQRLHANRWTSAREVWLPTWPALARPKVAPKAGQEVWLGVDVGISNDSTAIAMAWRHSDTQTGVSAHIFANRGDTMAHTHFNGKIDWTVVESYIRGLGERYRVKLIAYDPQYFQRTAATLSSEGFNMVELVQASKPMSNAYASLFAAVTNVQIVHDGDPILASHVAATAAVPTERGWSVRKLRSKRKIDGTVAVAAAHTFAATPVTRSPYESRGLVVLG